MTIIIGIGLGAAIGVALYGALTFIENYRKKNGLD